MSNDLERFINENKEAFDTKMPNPAVLQRIQDQMQGKAKKKAVLIPMQTLRWAAAILVIMAGTTVYFLLQKNTVTEKAAVATVVKPAVPMVKDSEETKEPLATTASQKNTAIDEAIHQRKQILFAKLNDMGSSSERLSAAAQAYELKNTGNDIVDALVKTMNTDPSTNVRLAALEGLSKFYREAYVKKQLIASLKKQNDPMVQIELIQLLTKMKETAILNELERIVKDGNTMDAVKDHAYASMFSLRS